MSGEASSMSSKVLFKGENDGAASSEMLQNPLRSHQQGTGSSSHNTSSSRLSDNSANSMLPQDSKNREKGVVHAPELADWLNFWKMKRESFSGDALDFLLQAKNRHKHWTPDRGPGDSFHWHDVPIMS
jgi:hypothetical protein